MQSKIIGVDHELPDSETYGQLKLDRGITDTILSWFFDGQIMFMSVMETISASEDTSVDHANNVKVWLKIINNLLSVFVYKAQPKHHIVNRSVMEIFNTFNYDY